MSKLVLAGVAAALLAGGRLRQDDQLGRLRWLAGCWELNRGNLLTFEMWMPRLSSQQPASQRSRPS